MIIDIKINKLLIILLFMFAETPIKPKFIKKFTDEFPIYRWLILFLITMKRKNGIIYFYIFFILYQLLYIIDSIYFTSD
jgi:hypothetical protein